MKRVNLSIQSKRNPDKVIVGHALSHEFSQKQISFFTTQKIPLDEELIISFDYNGTPQKHELVMKQIQEQISSGRVMNALPTEQNPFPLRKFYRCYAWMSAAIAAAAAKAAEAAKPADAKPADGTAAPVTGDAATAPVAAADGTTATPPAATAAPTATPDATVAPAAAPTPEATPAANTAPAPEQKAA